MRSTEHTSDRPCRILIVENEIMLVKDLAQSLKNLGYEVVGRVASAEEAFRIVEESMPDLILMDIKLDGEIDGIEAAEQIRSRFDIPVVYLTGFAEKDAMERAKKSEPCGYLSKPVGLLELKSTIETAQYKHEADKRVKESEERLTLALEGADLGTWDWNVKTGEQIFDRRWAEMLGYSLEEITPHVVSWEGLIHPEDMQTAWAAMNEHLQGFTPGYNQEQRLRTKSGEWKWILSRAKIVERDKDGRPLRVSGTHLDITERKKSEETLQQLHAELERRVEERAAELVRANRELQKEINRRKVAEEELEANRARIEYLLSHGPAVIYTCEPSGDYGATFISENIKAQMGYKPTDFTEDRSIWASHIHHEDRERVFSGLKSLLEHDHHIHEYRFRHGDGTYKWMRDELILYRDVEGNPQEILGYWSDITDRKNAEESLARSHEELELRVKERTLELTRTNELLGESEKKYRTLVSNIPDVTWTTDCQGGTKFISPNVETIYGYSPEEVYKEGERMWFGRIHPDDRERVREAFRRLFETGKRFDIQYRMKRKDGEWIWLHDRAVTVYEKEGVPYADGVFTDITDRKRAEEALRKSEEHYRAVFDNAGIGIDSLDRNGRILKVNRALSEMLGYTEDELRHLGFLDITHPDDRELSKRPLESVLAGEIDSYRTEKRYLCKDGTFLWADLSASAVRGEGGEHRGIVGVIADITARKMVEEALRESEAQKQAILDGITTNMAFVNKDLEILWVNKTAADSVEKSPEEMLGHTCHKFWADPERPCDNCPTVKAFKTRKSEHVEIVTPDGRVWDEKGEPVFDEEGNLLGVIEIAQDITERRMAEEELSQSEERYRRIVETANEGIWAMDREFRTTFVNRKMADMLGYSVEDMLCHKVDSFMFQEDLGDHKSKMEARRQGGDQIYERRFRRKDGETLWTTVSATALKDSEGNFAGSFAMLTDITNRKKIEVVLREREEQLQAIFEASPAAIFLVNPEGRITFANQIMGTLFSCESEELLGTPYVELVHPEERTIGHGKMKSLMAGQIDHVSLERRYVSADGREFLGHLSGRRLLGPDGDLTGLVGIITDITDRKKAEEALRESEEHYKNFFDNALVGLFRSRISDGLFIDINAKAAEQQGLPVEEIVGKVRSSDRYRNPHQREELISRLRQDGEVHDFEADLTLHDGRDVTFSISVKAYPEEDYMEGAVIDITDRKKAEEALRKSEDQYRHLYNNAELGLFQTRVSDGKIVMCNQRCAEITGYDDIGQFIEEYVVSEHYVDPAVRLRLIEELKRTGSVKDFEAQITDRWGTPRWWCYSVKHYPEKGVMEGSILDITDRKQAEQAIRESQRRYRTLFEQSKDAILIVHPEGMIIDANAACWDIFGAARDEIVGANILQFYRNPSDRDRLREGIGLKGFVKDFDWRVKQKTGGERHCLLTSTAWKDDHGTVLGHLSIARDITDSKRLEEQLIQSQKMEAVGTLAGGIAHDFNNLLQVIQGYADLGLLDIRRDEPGYSTFLEIRSAARKAGELTRSLLTFSRRVEGQLRPLDLNQELIQISKMLERTIPKMIAIDLEVASDLQVVQVDPGQFQQALMNLAVNARDAMPEGGRLVIQTANVDLDEEYCKAHIGAEPGTHVMLAVSDTGCGMDKDTQEKIFDPFFTTKEVGKGTGLGLSIVFGIVKSHGGTITCYSEPGEGTTFKIYFPAIKQAQGHEVEVQSERLIGGTETILLVDDEDAVRKLGESILRRFGYTVLTASNGLEALEVFQNQKERIPLVILDLIMPEMGGRECLREIMRIDPAAKVLIASGYGANGQIDGALEEGAKTSIRKPYEAKELLRAVRDVLDTQ
ncbi:PAS domain S-box protein [Thermodesulfobacteriota bacterium]